MTEKNLRHVIIDKHATCLSYAFDRTGTITDCKQASDLESYYELIPFQKSRIRRGSIVVWENDKEDVSAGFEIMENGMIITSIVKINRHLGVIEDDKGFFVSDVTRKLLPTAVPTIRIRRLLEDCTVPNFILKPKFE